MKQKVKFNILEKHTNGIELTAIDAVQNQFLPPAEGERLMKANVSSEQKRRGTGLVTGSIMS